MFFEMLPEDKQEKRVGVAVEGDYRTLTCPQRSVKMVLRESKKPERPGKKAVLGMCTRPRCKQALVYQRE